jgi:hypothetical protein
MDLGALQRKLGPFLRYGADTALVAFFLGLELGSSTTSFGIDSVLLLVTAALVIVFPYLLLDNERPLLIKWLLVRSGLAAIGGVLGMLQSLALSDYSANIAKFLPLSLLLLASGISCTIRFYALMRLRLAK